jgi:hypothetical protein
MLNMLFSKSLTLLLSLSGCGACIVPILIFWLNNRFKTIAPIVYTYSLLELKFAFNIKFLSGISESNLLSWSKARSSPICQSVRPLIGEEGLRERVKYFFFSVFFSFGDFFCPTFKLASRQAVMQSKRSCPSPLSLTKEREREIEGGREVESKSSKAEYYH